MKELTTPLILKCISLILCLFVHPLTHAQNGWGEKTEQKKTSGWSLQEWLDMKDRNRLMDQWLMMNSSPTLYEFYIGYQPSQSVDLQGQGQGYDQTIELLAYATLFGLSARALLNGSGWDLGARMRLLGSSDQATNLTFEYGARQRKLDETSTEQYPTAKALITLNITKVTGLILSAQHVFSRGEEYRGGLFLDFGPLRIQGQWYQEINLEIEENAPRKGLVGGVGLYF